MKKVTPVQVRELIKRQGVGPVAMPADHYHGMDDFISNSVLGKMKSTPAKFKWAMNNPRTSSAAQSLGTAIHAAILEPDLFEATYRVRRDKPKEPERPDHLADQNKKSKAGKALLEDWEASWKPGHDAAIAAWELEREQKCFVSNEDMETIKRVHEVGVNDKYFSQFFTGPTRESNFFAKCPVTDMLLRCRCDNFLFEQNIIVDLKTTDCADEWEFNNDITKFEYYVQAAFYMDVVHAATGKRPDAFVIIAAEKKYDCDMNAFYLKEKDLDLGRKKYLARLHLLKDCIANDRWPGYERRFISYKPPRYLEESLSENGA